MKRTRERGGGAREKENEGRSVTLHVSPWAHKQTHTFAAHGPTKNTLRRLEGPDAAEFLSMWAFPMAALL